MKEFTQKQGFARQLLSWAKVVASAFLVALFVNNCLLVNASIVSGSMESTIMTGDRVLGSRLAYIGEAPKRYDIIFFAFPYGDEPVNYVKRVIGLPGEKVEIIDGKVYINGSSTPLPDGFTEETPHGDFGPYNVPEGHYFVLGDNRNASYDSKSWPNPYLPAQAIKGRVFCAYYPHAYILRDVTEVSQTVGTES